MNPRKKDPDFLVKPEWRYNNGRVGFKVRLLRFIASFTSAWCDVVIKPNPNGDMISTEQRLNLHHLLLSVTHSPLKSDILEFGAFEGQASVQIAETMAYFDSQVQLHLYDNFSAKYNGHSNVKNRLIDNFNQRQLPLPIIHEMNIEDLLSEDLPNKISFMHIDIGIGQSTEKLQATILHILHLTYSIMEPGAVCLLMDYHDREKQAGSTNPNPGVKLACDLFLNDKPEKIVVLFGGPYSHAYFRKI